jgi:hypothetical protein
VLNHSNRNKHKLSLGGELYVKDLCPYFSINQSVSPQLPQPMIPDSSIPRLTTKRELDQSTGQSSTTYFWDGKPVPQVKLSGAVAEQLSGLALIQKDLTNALRWIDNAVKLLGELEAKTESQTNAYSPISNREVGDQIKAYFVSSLVFYAKAFTEAGGRRAQIARDWLDVQFRDTHDYFMMFRHNMAAHSGDEKLEIGHTCLILIPSSQGYAFRIGTHRCQPDLAISESDEKQFRDLIAHAIEKVSERYNKTATRTIELAFAKGTEFWLVASSKGEAVDATELHKNER